LFSALAKKEGIELKTYIDKTSIGTLEDIKDRQEIVEMIYLILPV